MKEDNSERKIVVTFSEDGNAQIDIDGGISAMMLYGVAGLLQLYANSQAARQVAQSMQRSGGIVVPQ